VHVFVGLQKYMAQIKHRVEEMSRKTNAQFKAKRVFRPSGGLSIELSVGWQNDEILPIVGAKNQETGWPLFIHIACSQILLNIICG